MSLRYNLSMLQDMILSFGDNRKKYTLVLLLLIMGEFLFVSQYFSGQKSEVERTFILGYSISRFSTIILLNLGALTALILSFSVMRGNIVGTYLDRVFRNSKIRLLILWIASPTGIICWVVFFIPPTYFNLYEDYIALIKPLMLLGIVVSCQIAIFMFLTEAGRNDTVEQFFAQNKRYLLLWVMVWIICMGIWSFISISEIGLLANNEDYWYEAGVPILGLQILLGVLAGFAFVWFEMFWRKNSFISNRGDMMIFMLVWIVGGLLWMRTPVPNGYLNPGPYPPTYETYPFADAARFDLMSQYALIGQGLNNGRPYNRPVYPAFLVFLHAVSGQNYEQNMQLQAFLYGVFPAIIYLIAKLLFNRGAGLAMAAIIIMRGINGIAATNMLNLANQKQMLTDFPIAIGVAAILLICILMIRMPRKLYLSLLAGGLFGISFYLRQTVLGLLPFLFVLPVLQMVYSRKIQISIIGLFMLGAVMVITPYELNKMATSPNYTYPATIRKIISLVTERYPQVQKDLPDYADQSTVPTDELGIQEDGSAQRITNSLDVIGIHFLHNVITSTLVLPTLFKLEGLRDNIKSENSLWNVNWDGHLTPVQSFVLGLNIMLISLGVALAVARQPLAGLMPLAFFIAYNFTNALGRTSGGRYIVPVDWIVILYFTIGLFQVFAWVFMPNKVTANFEDTISIPLNKNGFEAISSYSMLVSIFALVFIGGLLILPDYIFPQQMQKLDRVQTWQEVMKFDMGKNQPYLEEIIESERTVILTGKIMYPRYYKAGVGEFSYYFPYKPMDFRRLAFYLIGADGTNNILLAGPVPNGLVNTENVIVIGCQEKEYIEAVFVIPTDRTRHAYVREPLMDSACPSVLP